MLENVLFIAAAITTVLGFILELWREWKTRSDDKGQNKKIGDGRGNYHPLKTTCAARGR